MHSQKLFREIGSAEAFESHARVRQESGEEEEKGLGGVGPVHDGWDRRVDGSDKLVVLMLQAA